MMEIYLLLGQQESGPHVETEVRAMVSSGQAARTTLAWREGMAEWQPLEQIIELPARPKPPPPPKGLPPLPPRNQPIIQMPHPGGAVIAPRSTAMRTISGVIALILGLLAIFNIGGCMNAQSKLARFQSGSDPQDVADMFVQTVRGANQGDPLAGVSGLLDSVRSLREEHDACQLGAWLCLIGSAAAGAVFLGSAPRKEPASP